MSERPHGSQAPAAEDPAECLKAVANDAEPLREQVISLGRLKGF